MNNALITIMLILRGQNEDFIFLSKARLFDVGLDDN